MKSYKLLPFLSYKIWGGTKLANLKKACSPHINGTSKGLPLGETWEVSRHRDGVSKTVEGNLDLSLITTQEELPYLVKFIDTSDNLSIQVHPHEEYAKKVENDNGKSECWIILEACEGSGIYLGLKDGVTKEILAKAIESQDDVSKLLNFYPVKKGDFFFVDTGSIHAIGKNITLCEVQQSSGVTYRVWDWNRLDDSGNSRELHVKKAMDVINFEADKNKVEFFKYEKDIFKNKAKIILTHSDFKLETFNLKDEVINFKPMSNRVVSIIVLDGEINVNGNENISSYESFIYKNAKEIKIEVLKEARFLIIS